MRNPRSIPLFFCWLSPLLLQAGLPGAQDTLGKRASLQRDSLHVHEVRNYIRPCFSLDYFGTSPTALNATDGVHPNAYPDPAITQKLGNYSFAETNINFYTPLFTKTSLSKDSTDINTFHLLFTVNGLFDRPEFSGLANQHKINKFGMGLRMLYGFNSRFVLFADMFPYSVNDKYEGSLTRQKRMSSTFIFNWMIRPWISVRAGITKTYLVGNRFYLPVLGVRLGKLDSKFYCSFQFPRYASFNYQPWRKLTISLYSRLYGSLYTLTNKDSIYPGPDTKIQMGQSGVAHGLRFDFRPGPDFDFFISAGYHDLNTLTLYSFSFNKDHPVAPLAHFYRAYPAQGSFVNVGFTWRFGKAKVSTGNYLMYDVFNLNNDFDPGDNNSMPGNGDIPARLKYRKDFSKVQYKDVQDLIDASDIN